MTLGLGLLLTNNVFAQGVGSSRCDLTQLKLTESQKRQIREFKPENRPSRAEMRQEWRTYRQQTEAIIKQKDFNEKKAQAVINAKLAKESDLQLEHLRARHAFFQILNEKQKRFWLKECSLDIPEGTGY